MKLLDTIKNKVSNWDADDWAGVTVAGLGLGLYGANCLISNYHRKKQGEQMERLMNQLPPNLKNSNLRAMNNISKKLGLKLPIAMVTDEDTAKVFGVADNAYYMAPSIYAKGVAKTLKDYIKDNHKNADKEGIIVLSDKYSPVPILAHELGHARDYKDGKLRFWPGYLSTLLGIGSGLALVHTGVTGKLYDAIKDKTGSDTLGGVAAAALASLPSALAAIYNNRRSLAAERRATEHAKKILASYRDKKAVNTAGKLLDTAYSTYVDGYNFQLVDRATIPMIYGGLGPALEAITKAPQAVESVVATGTGNV